jgi:hypothetical protein
MVLHAVEPDVGESISESANASVAAAPPPPACERRQFGGGIVNTQAAKT